MHTILSSDQGTKSKQTHTHTHILHIHTRTQKYVLLFIIIIIIIIIIITKVFSLCNHHEQQLNSTYTHSKMKKIKQKIAHIYSIMYKHYWY